MLCLKWIAMMIFSELSKFRSDLIGIQIIFPSLLLACEFTCFTKKKLQIHWENSWHVCGKWAGKWEMRIDQLVVCDRLWNCRKCGLWRETWMNHECWYVLIEFSSIPSLFVFVFSFPLLPSLCVCVSMDCEMAFFTENQLKLHWYLSKTPLIFLYLYAQFHIEAYE